MISENPQRNGDGPMDSPPDIETPDCWEATEALLRNAPPEIQKQHRENLRISRGNKKKLIQADNERRLKKAREQNIQRARGLLIAAFVLTVLYTAYYTGRRSMMPTEIPEITLDPYEANVRYKNTSITLPPGAAPLIVVKMRVMKDAQTIGLHVNGGDVVGFDSADQFKRIKDARRLVRFNRTQKNLWVLFWGEQTVSFEVLLNSQGKDDATIYGWAAIRGWAKNAQTGNGGKHWFWQELKLRVQTTPPVTLPGFSPL